MRKPHFHVLSAVTATAGTDQDPADVAYTGIVQALGEFLIGLQCQMGDHEPLIMKFMY